MSDIQKSAAISKCGKFRYRLGRRWGDGPTVLYVMLNPSTASAEIDDPTIRRCISFGRVDGFGALEVVNLFAYRTAYPNELKARGFPVGPDNDRHIMEAAQAAERICVAWGAHQDAQPRVQVVMPLLRASGLEPYCLAITRSGFPAHPVRLAKSCWMYPFSVEAIAAAMAGREPPFSMSQQAPKVLASSREPELWPFPVSAHQETQG